MSRSQFPSLPPFDPAGGRSPFESQSAPAATVPRLGDWYGPAGDGGGWYRVDRRTADGRSLVVFDEELREFETPFDADLVVPVEPAPRAPGWVDADEVIAAGGLVAGVFRLESDSRAEHAVEVRDGGPLDPRRLASCVARASAAGWTRTLMWSGATVTERVSREDARSGDLVSAGGRQFLSDRTVPGARMAEGLRRVMCPPELMVVERTMPEQARDVSWLPVGLELLAHGDLVRFEPSGVAPFDAVEGPLRVSEGECRIGRYSGLEELPGEWFLRGDGAGRAPGE